MIAVALLGACPHPGAAAAEVHLPDAVAWCAVAQGPADQRAASTAGLGFHDVFVGPYGTIAGAWSEAVPRSALVEAWGPVEVRTPLHPEDDPELWWTLPPCSLRATLGAGDRVVTFMVRDDRLPLSPPPTP